MRLTTFWTRRPADFERSSRHGGMTDLELASGMVRGVDTGVKPLPPPPANLSARDALEATVRHALERGPCVVSFSGGRDSSAVLALATHVARRDGLPDPIPVSQRFPQCDGADEDHWQELVIRHLGLDNWVRLTFDAEMDNVGPFAREVFTKVGILWPSNAHFHLPVVNAAQGGSVLTGFGGDELLTPTIWRRVNRVLGRQIALTPRDALRVGVAYGPSQVRRLALERKHTPLPRPWLRPDAERAVTAAALEDLVTEPIRWDDMVTEQWWRMRYRQTAEASLAAIGAMRDAAVTHPLTDPVFLGCVAREGGRAGFRNRTVAMEYLVGDLLPSQVSERWSKGVLSGAFWNRHTREFVSSWDGSGVDPEIVDVDVLQRMWTDEDGYPDARSSSLLQAAWIACHGDGSGPASHPSR